MKKRILNYVFKGTLVVALLSLFSSCIGYHGVGGYDDGIYGESAVRYTYGGPRFERPDYEERHPSQNSYKAYLQKKADQYRDFQNELQEPSYTPLSDINNYRTPDNNRQQTYNSYAGWGENPRETSVTIYNNYGGWGSPYYWGSGAWYYPYYGSYYYPYYYGYNYYRPYRSGWSISIGSYPYYSDFGYYRGFYSPYYYGFNYYYYRPYYYNSNRYYYDGNYYRRQYDNRIYSPTTGVRGDSRRYEDYNRSNQNSNTRYYPYSNNSNNRGGDTYSRSYHNNRNNTPSTSPQYRNDSSSRSYNSGNYNSSSRSYNSSGNSGSSSGSGTTRRNY